MEMMHPLILAIDVVIITAIFVITHIWKNKNPFSGGIKVANTEFLYETPSFKRAIRNRKILSIIFKIALGISLISSLLLASRPYRVSETRSGLKKRDIFLCLDVSYSLYDLNYELVDQLKEVVESMEGDRFGITIYNTSTILYVPLTDDYDFVLGKLEELKDYFLLQKEYHDIFWDYNYIPDELYDQYNDMNIRLRAIDAGTLVNNQFKGSSLIGEGLASCLYSFPHLEDESRTRAIIMATDNAQMEIETPIVELQEAAKLCQNHEVSIFGIFPDENSYDKDSITNYEQNRMNFIDDITGADGIVYEQSKTLTVRDIVSDISKHEAMEVKEVSTTKSVDQPELYAIFLLLGVMGIFISGGLLAKD